MAWCHGNMCEDLPKDKIIPHITITGFFHANQIEKVILMIWHKESQCYYWQRCHGIGPLILASSMTRDQPQGPKTNSSQNAPSGYRHTSPKSTCENLLASECRSGVSQGPSLSSATLSFWI